MRVLLDATGPLWQLHRRVLEAGCEVDPDWKLGMFQVWNGGQWKGVKTELGSFFCFAGKNTRKCKLGTGKPGSIFWSKSSDLSVFITQHTYSAIWCISTLAVIHLCWARTLCSGTMSGQNTPLQPRNPVKVLFVPITETQMAELQALSERGRLEDEKYCILLAVFFLPHTGRPELLST